jgi:hypothetical protein
VPVTYITFADEGHGFARPENRMAFYAATDRFWRNTSAAARSRSAISKLRAEGGDRRRVGVGALRR